MLDSKAEIRRYHLRKRISLGDSVYSKWSERICTRVLPFIRESRSLAFYFPLKGEVWPWHLLLEARRLGKKIFFPRISGKKLLFIPFSETTTFETGSQGVFQPEDGTPFPIQMIDCVLVPGIAFDHEGFRIGFGKGYYDRALKKYANLKIGLAYDNQIVPHLESREHDIPCDLVVSEKRIMRRTV